MVHIENYREVYGSSYIGIRDAYQLPHTEYRYNEAKSQAKAVLEQKFIEEKAALEQKFIEEKAALENKSTEEKVALENKFAEEKAALENRNTEEKAALENKFKEETKEEKGIKHLYEAHHVYAFDAYKRVLKRIEDGEERNVNKNEGPAIRMDLEDHRETSSCGGSDKAQTYRKAQSDLLKQGKFGEAWMKEVNDIRSKFGDKYDLHLVEAEAYLLKLHNDLDFPDIKLDPAFKQELEDRQDRYNKFKIEELKEIYDERQNDYVQKQKQDFNAAMSQWENIRDTEITNGKDPSDAVYTANADLYSKLTGKSYGGEPEKLSSAIEAYYITDCKQEFEKYNKQNINDQQQEQSQGITC